MTASATSPSPTPPLINPPSFIEHLGMRFLIFDAPNEDNLPQYMEIWEKHHVKHVVRACEATYERERLERRGIALHDLEFPDGTAPPAATVDAWLRLVDEVFPRKSGSAAAAAADPNTTIGVHCVAGLGRAPILVAIALMDRGVPALQAVEFIRRKRRGAINVTQLRFVKDFKPRSRSPCLLM